MRHVDNEPGSLVGGIGDARHAGTGRGSELGEDIAATVSYGVVAHRGFLVGMGKFLGEGLGIQQCGERFAGRLYEYVEQVYATRATEVGMREAVDGIERVVVT